MGELVESLIFFLLYFPVEISAEKRRRALIIGAVQIICLLVLV